jgi:hypothetical protein
MLTVGEWAKMGSMRFIDIGGPQMPTMFVLCEADHGKSKRVTPEECQYLIHDSAFLSSLVLNSPFHSTSMRIIQGLSHR